MKKDRKTRNEENKRRYEAIKDLMSTFAMSTVAVIAVVTLIPSSPKAKIVKAVALTEEIVYQVNVTDEENALDLDTLVVVLENQLETYEQPLQLGEYSGFFEDLSTATEYRLSVYGDKGFGLERLDTLLITTGESIGGTILSVTPQENGHSTSYLVDVYVNDPDGLYSNVTLFYGYSTEWDDEIQYTPITVDNPRMSVEINDIFTSEEFHIYLEGTSTDGSEIMDEIYITPPFELYTSVYLEYMSKDEIGFYLYADINVEEISYKMNIYQNDFLQRTEQIELNGDIHGSFFVIKNLKPNSSYSFECIATYKNPKTLRTESMVVYEEELTTLGDYSYTYTIETIGEYYEISVTVVDPNHHFQMAIYESYDISGEHDLFLNTEAYPFTNNGDNKSATFSVFIPIVDTYRISISINNELDHTIKHVIDIITNE